MCLTHETARKLSIHAGIFLYVAASTVAVAAAATVAGVAGMQRKYEGG